MNKMATFFRESSVARFFIPAGVILIVFGIVVFIINTGNKDYIEAEAIISKVELAQESYKDSDGKDVDATYYISVKYVVDGKEYETELGELPKHNEGEKIKIYYNPSDPNQITQTKSLILPLVLIAGGIAALAGGVISGKNAIKRYKKMRDQEKG